MQKRRPPTTNQFRSPSQVDISKRSPLRLPGSSTLFSTVNISFDGSAPAYSAPILGGGAPVPGVPSPASCTISTLPYFFFEARRLFQKRKPITPTRAMKPAAAPIPIPTLAPTLRPLPPLPLSAPGCVICGDSPPVGCDSWAPDPVDGGFV